MEQGLLYASGTGSGFKDEVINIDRKCRLRKKMNLKTELSTSD